MTVEKEFYYSDFTRGFIAKVKPRQDRHAWREASRELDREVVAVPAALVVNGRQARRVVFGLGELREKLLAQDAGLDDREAELLKVLVVHEHPFLLHKPRLRLMLDRVTQSDVQFVAAFDHDDQLFRATVPRSRVEEARAGDGLKALAIAAHGDTNIFASSDSGDHWVNMWRWSPQPGALEGLHAAASKVRNHAPIDVSAAEFIAMLEQLPRGAHLPAWAKADLQVLFDYARGEGNTKLQDQLFEIRFGKTLDDDWGVNQFPDDVETMWRLLDALPASNVEGNVFLDEIAFDAGVNGGFYNPQTYDIYLGADVLTAREAFEDVLRHEVGHAVHEQRAAAVNQWLQSRFGWQMFEAQGNGVDQWVGLMGGWGQASAHERMQIRDYLRQAVGSGSSWEPGAAPNPPAGHLWWTSGFGPREAYQRSDAYWYRSAASWYRRDGRAFFVNFWYGSLCVVSEDTLALVANMPSDYAAMSPLEFFAELYALYFDLDDPQRSAIPPDVIGWLDQHVAASIPSIAVPSAPVTTGFDWIERPAS